MTEVSPQSELDRKSYLSEENNSDEEDGLQSNVADTKCGEIILLANTKFCILCTFCDESFYSIIVFGNHVKTIHITNPEDLPNIKDDDPLNLNPKEKCIIEGEESTEQFVNECNEGTIYKRTEEDEIIIKDYTTVEDNNDETQYLINGSNKNGINNNISSHTENICRAEEDNLYSNSESLYVNKSESKTKNNLENIVLLLPKSKNSSKNTNRKKKVYACSHCQLIVRNKVTLEHHIQTNHGTGTRHQCEQCGKCFRNRSNLRSHQVIHSGTRPYKCNFCNADFTHYNGLKAHRYIHTGNRPYDCIQCDKSFVSSGALRIHMREHTGETPFLCEFCEKPFATQCSYKRHMISHSGERPHVCKQCKKSFIHKDTLTNHMACHSTEKTFVCDNCSKKFNCLKNLNQHKKLHLNIKQYVCKLCSKDFAQNAGLYAHMKSHKNRE